MALALYVFKQSSFLVFHLWLLVSKISYFSLSSCFQILQLISFDIRNTPRVSFTFLFSWRNSENDALRRSTSRKLEQVSQKLLFHDRCTHPSANRTTDFVKLWKCAKGLQTLKDYLFNWNLIKRMSFVDFDLNLFITASL